jgi:sugar phosphate permease
VLARIFRPTFLATFNLTNLEIGLCFSVYGITALISYLFGGVLADRFKPHKLMATALWLTALGGFYLATKPNYMMLKVLYGYWGFTTIFLFWAAMIKATRIWGGIDSQGKAFGFLDGGRGLVGALFGSLGVLIFSFLLPDDVALSTEIQRSEAFIYVIRVTSVLVILIGFLVFFFMKLPDKTAGEILIKKQSIQNIKTVLKLPAVWLLMIIILCAYVGYKITDVFSLYAKEVMLYNEVDAAKTGTFLLFIRPVVGILIGVLADRTRASVYLVVGFGVSIVGALLFASDLIDPSMDVFFLLSLFLVALGVYAARVLYFAVMEEGNIPIALTGTAVGVISFIGYTPDIFAGPLMGYLLDNSPGRTGHQHVFMMLAVFSLIGFIASLFFLKLHTKKVTG